MATPTTKTELIVVSEHELVKQYQELDGVGRPFKLYTAPAHAEHGAPCLVTEFIYNDISSTVLKAKKEGYDTWDTSWVPDSTFTVDANGQDSKTMLFLTNQNELTKEYQEVDGQDRPVKIYKGPVSMVTGSICIVTEYIYQNPTSSVLLGRKEGYSTWDESWVPDSAFSVDY